MKVISDIQPSFVNGYLLKADINQLLVTEVYNQAQSYAGEILTANTPLGNEFKDSLTIDANGNQQCMLRINEDEHKITLNRHSKCGNVEMWIHARTEAR